MHGACAILAQVIFFTILLPPEKTPVLYQTATKASKVCHRAYHKMNNRFFTCCISANIDELRHSTPKAQNNYVSIEIER